MLVTQIVKNMPAIQETCVWYQDQEYSLEREWLPTPAFLPGEFHGQRSLAGYSPWGGKKSDTTECLILSLFIEHATEDWKKQEVEWQSAHDDMFSLKLEDNIDIYQLEISIFLI